MFRFVSWNTLAFSFFLAFMVLRTGLVYTVEDECRQQKYISPVHNSRLTNHIIKNLTVPNEPHCNVKCFIDPDCVSYNFGPRQGDGHSCELSNSDKHLHPGDFVTENEYSYYGTENACRSHSCHNEATCQSGFTGKGYRCVCRHGYTGTFCESAVYNYCSDAPPHATGIYHILGFGEDSFPVYCDQTSDGGGWTMVFKAVGGVASPVVASLWESPETLSETNIAALDTSALHKGHYKNRIVLNWEAFNPKEVRVVLYKNDIEVKSLKFDAVGSNNRGWFSKEKIVLSSWIDLDGSITFVQFGIKGDVTQDGIRSFEIMKTYGGCENDFGWLVITGYVCPWEYHQGNQSILYSNISDSGINFHEHVFNGRVGVADVLAVFIR